MRAHIFVSFLLLIGACSRNSGSAESPGETVATPVVSTEDAERNLIDSLETAARAVADRSGCSSAADCRAAPIGVRGCGGPRDFIVYCAATTDSAALYRKISAADSAEAAYNRKYSVISTCELRMPPALESSGGSCSAKSQ